MRHTRIFVNKFFSDAPRTTKSMHVVIEDLELERLWVVYHRPLSQIRQPVDHPVQYHITMKYR